MWRLIYSDRNVGAPEMARSLIRRNHIAQISGQLKTRFIVNRKLDKEFDQCIIRKLSKLSFLFSSDKLDEKVLWGNVSIYKVKLTAEAANIGQK